MGCILWCVSRKHLGAQIFPASVSQKYPKTFQCWRLWELCVQKASLMGGGFQWKVGAGRNCLSFTLDPLHSWHTKCLRSVDTPLAEGGGDFTQFPLCCSSTLLYLLVHTDLTSSTSFLKAWGGCQKKREGRKDHHQHVTGRAQDGPENSFNLFPHCFLKQKVSKHC